MTCSPAAYRAHRIWTALAGNEPLPAVFWAVWVPTVASFILTVATIIPIIAEV